MSKRRTRQPNAAAEVKIKEKARASEHRSSRRRNVRHRQPRQVIALLCVLLGLMGAAFAQWRGLPLTKLNAATTTAPAALLIAQNANNLAPNKPAKEYIYGGGRLLATEEPTASPTPTPTPAPTNNATFVSQSVPATMIAGQSYQVSVVMRNSGTTTWTSNSSHSLGSQNAPNNITWGLGRVSLPSTIAPESSATFNFTVIAPSAAVPTAYNFQWKMVQDNVEWFGDQTPKVAVTVNPHNDAQFISQSNVPQAMIVGQSYPVSVTMQNTGTTTWTSGSSQPYRLAYLTDALTWGVNRVELPSAVAPGGTVTFNFAVTPSTPSTQGTPPTTAFQWGMVQDGVERFGGSTPNIAVTVNAVHNDAAFVSQSVPQTMIAGQSYPVSITLQNTGNTTWSFQSGSSNNALYQLISMNQLWGTQSVLVDGSVAPGQSKTFSFNVTAPATPGPTNNFQWRMLQGNVEYFGAYTTATNVTVTAPTGSGALTGGVAVPASSVNLTQDGTQDWAHWGMTSSSSFNHKTGVAQSISNYSVVGTNGVGQYGGNAAAFNWSDGTPTPSTNTATGLYINGVGNGFRITVPADTTSRTLRLYVGGWYGQGRLEASLSDGSAPLFVDSSLSNNAGSNTGNVNGVYTLDYRAYAAGQTLTVTYTLLTDFNAPYGNITFQAATLTTNAPPATGTLSGAKATPAGTVNLTQQGTQDWAHWSLTAPNSLTHKAGITQLISDYTVVGTTAPSWYGDNPFAFTWTNGTPTASATTSNGSYVSGMGNGFRISAPADATTRTLKVYVGVWYARGKLEARLSDNSAPVFIDTGVGNSTGTNTGHDNGVYTLTYKAASSGQKLTVTYTLANDYNAPYGNITFQAAALSNVSSPFVVESVTWTNVVGMSASGSNLTKTAGTGWNTGAISTKSIPSGDGYVEFTAGDNTLDKVIGLSHNSNQAYYNIDFGIYLGGTVLISEAGNIFGNFGAYSPGDRFRVSIEGGLVKYRKNGTLFYTSAVVPTYPLLVSAFFYGTNASITNAVIAGTYQHALSAENAAWTNVVGASVSGSSITKTAGNGWNSGALSTRALVSGDGYAEMTSGDNTTDKVCGLSHNTNQGYWNIDYGLYFGGTVSVYEAGTYRGDFGVYALGDRFRVSIEDGVVKYRKNGVLFYTSTTAPAYPLVINVSLHGTGGSINDAAIAGTLQ